MPPIRSGFTDFTQALYSTTNNVINILDQQMKEKARSDLLNMQANLDIESNRFMLELQNSNDYENWNQRYDEFIKKQGDILQKNSRNQYTATAAKEMLQNYEVNMRKKVETQVFNMGNQDILRKNNDTEKLIMGNKGITGQDKMNQLSNIANREVLRGLINGDQYEAKLKNYGTNLYLDYYGNMGADLIKVAIQNGKSFDWIENQINGDEFNIELKAVAHGRNTIDDYDSGNAQFTDITHTLDKSAIKSEALKSIKQSYNATVKTMQDQNRTELSEMNTRIEALNTYSERLYAYKAALNKLNNDYQGLALDASVRDHYTSLWKDKIKEIGDTGPSGTSGKPMALDAFYRDNDFTSYMQRTNEGEFNSTYDALDFYFDDMKEKYMYGNFKETIGMTDREKEYYWEQEARPRLQATILNSRELQNNMQTNFAGLYDKYKQFTKDFNANPKDYSQGSLDYVNGLINDLVLSSNGKTDKAALETQVAKTLDLLKLGKFDKALKGNLEKQLTFAEDNPDIVYTDSSNNEQWLPGAKEKMTSFAENLGKEMSAKTGKDLVFSHFEKIPNETNPIPIYKEKGDKSRNAKTYKAITVRDEKGKTKDISLIDAKTGEVIQNAPRKDGTTLDDYDALHEAKAAANDLKQQSKDQEKKVKDEALAKEQDLEKRAKQLIKSGDLPKDIKEKIKGMNPAEKRITIIGWLKTQENQ